MKGVLATGAQVLLYLPFVLSLSMSSEITFSSHWSGSPVCAGFTLEMTCIVHLTHGTNSVTKITVIKDRGEDSNMYCNVWPIPEGGEARCGSSSNEEDTMNLFVNGTMVADQSLVVLIVLKSVREADSGGYECSVGTDGSENLVKVSTTTLTLDVRQRSECIDLPEIPFYRSLVINSTNSPMCIFNVMPSSVPLWMADNEFVSDETVKFIKSGDYIATWINTLGTKNNNKGIYSCKLKLNEYQDDTIHLHTFEYPSIKFYPSSSCSHGFLFCIEAWVISSSDLLSPITCTDDDNFEVRYVGSRSAVISSCIDLDELQQMNNSSIRCEARNQFGRSEMILNVSLLVSPTPKNENVYPEETTASGLYLTSTNPPVSSFTFPTLFETILFSILVFSVLVVITCLGICGWKLIFDRKKRLDPRMKGDTSPDGYWSFLPKELKQRSIKERALPHRPDSVYASCETGLSVALPPEKEMKCPPKPLQPYFSSSGSNVSEKEVNTKCQFCSCNAKPETNFLSTYMYQDKIGPPENEQNYLMKEDFRPGYIVPLVAKQERDVTYNTYEMQPYSKLIGGRRSEGALRRPHSALYVSSIIITSEEELSRNRKYSF